MKTGKAVRKQEKDVQKQFSAKTNRTPLKLNDKIGVENVAYSQKKILNGNACKKYTPKIVSNDKHNSPASKFIASKFIYFKLYIYRKKKHKSK